MRFFMLVIFLFFIAACMSQETFNFIDSAVLTRLSRDVHILASDSFAGRKSGSAGEQKAYRYIISCFQEAGLKPAGIADSSFLQSFPIESLSIPPGSNTFEIEGRSDRTILNYDFSPTAYSANGRMEGNNYILVDLSQFREHKQKLRNDTLPSLRQVVRNAFQQGNSAVIFLNEWLLQGPDADSLYNRLKVKPEKGLVISVNYDIAAYLQKHPGVNIFINVDIERTSIICHNVIGFINNRAPSTVIIGAHYDHLGVNKQGKVFNGADDNGSGTAMLMELARYLKHSGDKTNNYLFIAFSGEEEGMYGSRYFVKHPLVDLQTINFMMNLDMVGRLGCEGNLITVFGTGTSPMWHTIYKETAHPKFRLCRMHGVHAFSDHLGFYRHGIPITSFTTGFHYEYHTTRDDAETINYRGMVDLVKYLQGLLHNAASGGKVGYHKVAGWYNFSTNLKIVLRGIDHILTVGTDN